MWMWCGWGKNHVLFIRLQKNLDRERNVYCKLCHSFKKLIFFWKNERKVNGARVSCVLNFLVKLVSIILVSLESLWYPAHSLLLFNSLSTLFGTILGCQWWSLFGIGYQKYKLPSLLQVKCILIWLCKTS